MALVFLPAQASFFLWDVERPVTQLAGVRGASAEVELVLPSKRGRVTGTLLPLLDTAAALAIIPMAELPQLSGSLAAWTLASKLALDLVSRERVVPTMVLEGGSIVARWGAALSASEDAAQVAALAQESCRRQLTRCPRPPARSATSGRRTLCCARFWTPPWTRWCDRTRGGPALPAARSSQERLHTVGAALADGAHCEATGASRRRASASAR